LKLIYGAPRFEQFIALHVRRADFDIWCPAEKPRGDCLPALSDFAHRVEEVKKQLATRARDPIAADAIQHVLITSNEPRVPPRAPRRPLDPVPHGEVEDDDDEGARESRRFWKEAKAYGWYSFDHGAEGTVDKFGP
jgi:hypothetical protein